MKRLEGNNKITKVFCFIFIVALFSGCDISEYQLVKEKRKLDESENYQLIEGKNGEIYRIDKKTGEMVVIKNNKIIPIELAESQIDRELLEKKLQEPIDWHEIQIPGKRLKTNLVMSWRDNKIYYKFNIYPYQSLLKIEALRKDDYRKYLTQKITISLLDKNGFLIKEIDIYLKEMTYVVDDKNNITHKSINSNLNFDKNDYIAIANYTIAWYLEDNLIPDCEIKTKCLDDFNLNISSETFMNVSWKMTEEEIGKIDNCVLSEPEVFLEIFFPKVSDMQRYKARVQIKKEEIGEVEKWYVFFDDRLFEIMVRATGTNLEELDKFVRPMLSSKYGEGKPAAKRDVDIKRIEWDTETILADYWLMKDNENYLAGLRIVNKSIHEALKAIEAFEEKENNF